MVTTTGGRLKFELREILVFLAGALAPAFAVGGGFYSWSVAMDRRVTVLEQTCHQHDRELTDTRRLSVAIQEMAVSQGRIEERLKAVTKP